MIIYEGEAGYDNLLSLYLLQGRPRQVDRSADSTLWQVCNQNDVPYFVQLNSEEPEPRDPDGRWGKYKFLAEPGQR